MTLDRDLKRIIRARMRKTGESYAAARARLVSSRPQTPPARGGTTGMYPFERFTERAKKALSLAQEEAERAHHSYIGTEHLLLGLLREKDGLAAMALANLGIEIKAVRKTIESVLGRNERIIIRQIIPTSRVKKVIEMAFEEARRLDQNFVGTEHLLLGLMIEGEGIACHVLEDLGVTLKTVRAELGRLGLQEGPEEHGTAGAPPQQKVPELAGDTVLVVRLAAHLARLEGSANVTAQHLRAVLGDEGAQSLVALQGRLAAIQADKEEAVRRQAYEAAAASRDEEEKVRKEIVAAEKAWIASLRKGRRRRPPKAEPSG